VPAYSQGGNAGYSRVLSDGAMIRTASSLAIGGLIGAVYLPRIVWQTPLTVFPDLPTLTERGLQIIGLSHRGDLVGCMLMLFLRLYQFS
jgi:hypothetical protein